LTTCECDLSFDIGDMTTTTYTYNNGLISTPTDTFQSCITGSTLRYRDVTDGGIAGIFSLTQQ
jgi:hypothetical protein